MTQAAEIPYNRYVGNGLASAFNIGFSLKELTDLEVELRDVDGNVVSIFRDGSATYDYALTGLAFNDDQQRYTSGLVDFNIAPPAGFNLGFRRVGVTSQELDLTAGGALPAQSLEHRLDFLTMMIQDVNAQLAGMPQAPIASDAYVDFGGRIARNADDPVLPGDLVTRGFITGQILVGQTADGYVLSSIVQLRAALVGGDNPTTAFVSGYYRVGDGGGGLYYYDPTSVAAEDYGSVIAPDAGGGRWLLNNNGLFHVAQFGVKGDATTDDTTALGRALSMLNVRKTGTLLFGGRSLRLYPTSTISGNVILQTITAARGIRLFGQGATLTIEDTFAGTETVTYASFTHCHDVWIDGLKMVSTPEAVGSKTLRGQQPFYFSAGCSNITYTNNEQIGGKLGVVTDYAPASADRTLRSHTFFIQGCYFEDVGYPLSFQNSGDNVTALGVRAKRPGRFYFAYGVSKHRMDLELLVGSETSPTCYLSTGITAAEAYLDDIELSIRAVDVDSAVQANLVGVTASVSAASPVAAAIRNVWASIDAYMVSAAPLYGLYTLGKVVDSGSADIVDRGHLFENIGVRRVVARNATNRGNLISLMGASQGTFGQGDVVRGLRLSNVVFEGTGTAQIEVCLTPIVDHLVLEHVTTPAAMTVTGAAQLGGGGCVHINTLMGGVRRGHVVDTLATMIGGATIGLFARQANLSSTVNGQLFGLPDGYAGQRLTLVLSSATTAIIVPTNFAGSPSNNITLNATGSTAEMLFQNGAWHLIGSYGVTVA